MARLQEELKATRSRLEKEQEEARGLRRYVQALEKKLNDLERRGDERLPLLLFTVDDSKAPENFVIELTNPSKNHIRITEYQAQSWLDGKPHPEPSSGKRRVTIVPGGANRFFTFNVEGDPVSLEEGKRVLRAAICLIYETVSETDRRRWLMHRWFQYEPHCPNDGCISYWQQDDYPLESRSDSCNLKRLMPHGWQDIRR